MTDKAIEVTATVIEPSNTLEVSYTPAVFTDNLAALEAYVKQEVDKYKGYEIDPKNYKQVKAAKDCMAELNKLKAPIEDERKRIKKVYEAPLKEFEARVKNITTYIDNGRDEIKEQVDEANNLFKEWRSEILENEYQGCAGAIADVIPFSALLDPKWLNRSTNEVTAINELYKKMEGAIAGYKTLQTKELKHKDQVVKHYADTLNLVEALQIEDTLNEKDRQMAEWKANQEAAEALAAASHEPEPLQEPNSAPEPQQQAAPEVLRWSLAMEFEGTREFGHKVAKTLKELGITGATIECIGVVNHG